jgi:hypothetical protein
MKSNEIIRRPPPPEGIARFELLHEDAQGNVLSYECDEGPGVLHQLGVGRQVDMPLIPFLGRGGNLLITIPTVGHAGFAADIQALTGWTMAIGIGTGAELAADTTLSSEITTYGGAAASVTPTILGNVVTWMHKWTFTTGANFTVTEAGVFRSGVLRMRHKYSASKLCVSTQHLTATLTDTL